MCKSHLLGSFSCLQNCLCSFAISLCKRIGHHLYLFFSFRVKALLSILCWERFATTSLSSRKNSYKWRYISSDEIKTWFRRLLWVFCLHFRWTWVTENAQQSTKPSFNLVSGNWERLFPRLDEPDSLTFASPNNLVINVRVDTTNESSSVPCSCADVLAKVPRKISHCLNNPS